MTTNRDADNLSARVHIPTDAELAGMGYASLDEYLNDSEDVDDVVLGHDDDF